jgi:peptide chain release factor 1
MKDNLVKRLDRSVERFEEIGRLLAQPDMDGGSTQFRELSMEYARLEPLCQQVQLHRSYLKDYEEAKSLSDESDPELKALAKEEVQRLHEVIQDSESKLERLLIPPDPDDNRNIFVEIRAGAGGDEAAIFAGDLYRMYARFADNKGWQTEVLSESRGEHGGFREIICRMVGSQVYAQLKFESGTHRVQRVPATEAQGRVHTSTCTVAILPEQDEVSDIAISEADLRIDTYRSSGAGGQHVNKTDSAVRITHLPTGIVVECQDERSQHKNRSRAMSLLRSRLLHAERERQTQQRAQTRKLQVGTGDRSERIRTYNFPQGRVTDHRIEFTLYRLTDLIDGQLDLMIEPLKREYEAEELALLE